MSARARLYLFPPNAILASASEPIRPRAAGPSPAWLNPVHSFFRHLFVYFVHLGAVGPLLLGILDSSFLFLPFGNDFLLVVLTARDPQHLHLYVFFASLGSTLGVLLLDLVCRKGGQEGLKRMLSRKRFEYLKTKMAQRSAMALVVACLAPPPFPFTVVVAAASAFQYARSRLLAVIFFARAGRFTLLGLLALWMGRQILRIINSEEFTWIMIGFIVVCLVGSAIQVFRWIQRSRLVPA
jgi:membrane protein YqaA with SNARE-associated domain